MGQRRTFSREFKLEAVKPVRDRGVSIAQAIRDLIFTITCCGNGLGSRLPTRRAHSLVTGR